MLERLGRLAARRPWRFVVAWTVIAGVVLVLAAKWPGTTTNDFQVPGTQSQAAQELLLKSAPGLANASVNVVYQAPSGSISSAANRDTVGRGIAALKGVPHVANVANPFAPVLPAGITPETADAYLRSQGLSADVTVDRLFPSSISADGHTALVSVQLDEPLAALPSTTFADVQTAARAGTSPSVTVELGGAVVDLQNPPPPGVSKYADEIGLLFAVLILLVALGSVTAMVVPIAVAVFGILISSSLLAIAERQWSIGSAAPELGVMIGLGVGIDYSLFIVNRYRQNLAEGMEVETAIGRAVSTSGSAVLFAAITVCLALSGLALIGIPYVATLGFAAAMFVAVTVCAALTVLPALLGLLGHRIDALRLPWHRSAGPAVPGAEPTNFSARWGREVAKHPVVFAFASIGLLLLLAVPLLHIQLGIPDDSTSPGSLTQTRAFDEVSRAFGPGQNGPLLVVTDFGPSWGKVNACTTGKPTAASTSPIGQTALTAQQRADLDAIIKFGNTLFATPGVKSVTPLPCTGRLGVGLIIPTTGPSDRRTTALVRDLRSHVVPRAVRGTPIAASSVYIGGPTAVLIDLTDTIGARMPLFIGAVLLLSFFLLLMVFRSVFVPIKAVIMNLLSIGAALGFLVALFQWGWLNWAFGIHETLAIVAFIPVMMFAVLFGLSMDYEVFLLSRIHEEWLRTHDHRQAMINGVGSTARVITAAALIMISVFLTFAFDPSVIVKMLALGMAAAVFIDATIVRMVAVPSVMELAGTRAWWIPAWLDRVLPHINVDAPSEPVDVEAGEPVGPPAESTPGA